MKKKQFILTGDMPTSCKDCEIGKYGKTEYENQFALNCPLVGYEVFDGNRYVDSKSEFCPLQDTTELLEIVVRFGNIMIDEMEWQGNHDWKKLKETERYKKLYSAVGGVE